MDDRDFRLLLYLQQDALQSHASLGRRLALTAPAVRQRMRGLERRGILRGFWGLIPASRLDRHARILWFGRGDWDAAAVRAALACPDVVWLSRKHDGGLSLQVYAPTAELDLSELEEVLGRPGSLVVSGPERAGPRILAAADWRIIRELVADPRMPIARLARRTGVTAKTARRRRAQLIARGDIEPAPILFEIQEPGMIIFHAAIFLDRPTGASAVRKAVPGAFVVQAFDDPPAAYLFCRAEELSGVWTAESRLRSIRGVRRVELTIDREFFPNIPRMQGWANEALEKSRLRLSASGRLEEDGRS